MSVTVAMTCCLKARSVVCRFLLAMWMKRSLLARPNPYRSGWLRIDLKIGIQFWIDCVIRAVVGGAEAGVVDLQVGAERKVLLVLRLDLDVVYLKEFDADLGNVRLRGDGVLHIAAEDEEGVERGNGRAGAERRGDDAAGACGRIRGAAEPPPPEAPKPLGVVETTAMLTPLALPPALVRRRSACAMGKL